MYFSTILSVKSVETKCSLCLAEFLEIKLHTYMFIGNLILGFLNVKILEYCDGCLPENNVDFIWV